MLLHAFPLSAAMWEPQLALAENGWRVIAPFLCGMGPPDQQPGSQEGRPRTCSSMDDFAGEVIDLLDALHVHEAVIAGLSMGGYAAFATFRLAPRYFRGLVLADTRPEADTPEAVEARKRMIALVREKGPAAVFDEMCPKLLGATTQRERPDVVERARALALTNSPDAIAGAITALMTRPDSTPLLSSIHCPTLVIAGEEDTLMPVAGHQQMQARVGGAELVVIPRAGHLSSLEAPDAFNGALARFLNHRV